MPLKKLSVESISCLGYWVQWRGRL